MPSFVTIPLVSHGVPSGIFLKIMSLPGAKNNSTLNFALKPPLPAGNTAAITEGKEYRYQWTTTQNAAFTGNLQADPYEIFQPDSEDGHAGRLRPGQYVGQIKIVLRDDLKELGHTEIEVISSKLQYDSEYQWMLRDITDCVTELVLNRFSVNNARFNIDECNDARTLYQRVMFLKALLENDVFHAAIETILKSPHVSWENEVEITPTNKGAKGNSGLARQIGKGGGRTAWINGVTASLPSSLQTIRARPSNNTTPNRFVKHALRHWRTTLIDVLERLQKFAPNSIKERGSRELTKLLTQLDETLSHPHFSSIEELTRFPADNQVLQKRIGYREIFRAYLEFELASRLSWHPNDETFDAAQRDAATLYEYWAFIQLAQILASSVGKSFDLSRLVNVSQDGLNIGIRGGSTSVFRGETVRHGRKLVIELWFNRTYSHGTGIGASWTREMRPDFSIVISAHEDELNQFEPVILHFDAKYKVNFALEIFGEPSTQGAIKIKFERTDSRRTDLLKMHSYRDSIIGSIGAYVLYPGGDDELKKKPFSQTAELLPGLGAFVLRPGTSTSAVGTDHLREFINAALDHVAEPFTMRERTQRRREEIYGTYYERISLKELEQLPPTTPLLCLSLPDDAHWLWTKKHQTVLISAEASPKTQTSNTLVQAQLILVYCTVKKTSRLAQIISSIEFINAASIRTTRHPSLACDCWRVFIRWLDVELNQSELYLTDEGLLPLAEPVLQVKTWAAIKHSKNRKDHCL